MYFFLAAFQAKGKYNSPRFVIMKAYVILKNSLLAAGSTITDPVADGDMGIARSRQENKAGYGTKYKNK